MWGRCGGDGGEGVLIDVSGTRVRHYQGPLVGPDPFSLPLASCLHDPVWLASGVSAEVGERERKEGRGGGLSEAVAIAELVRHWMDQSQDAENDNGYI